MKMLREESWSPQVVQSVSGNNFFIIQTGETINIPVILLTKQAGDKLIDSLKMDDDVVSRITLLFDFYLVIHFRSLVIF